MSCVSSMWERLTASSRGTFLFLKCNLNKSLLSFTHTFVSHFAICSSDSNSFYVPVTFEFDNKGAVIPGSFVEIYLLSSPMENVLSVPVSALIEEQGVYSVYVRLDEEGYLKKAVTLGADNGSEVQILSGLQPGDKVVTKGAYQIKLASASNAIPAHSHSH